MSEKDADGAATDDGNHNKQDDSGGTDASEVAEEANASSKGEPKKSSLKRPPGGGDEESAPLTDAGGSSSSRVAPKFTTHHEDEEEAAASPVAALLSGGGGGENLWLSMGIHRSDSTSASVRKRRMSKHRESLEMTPQNIENLPPGARVMFLLREKDEAPALFTEMGELTRCGDDAEEWKETARWVKFEEDVEEGGNRWSKPHVATLSLHALFQLRSCLLNGAVLIDLEAESLPHLIERILEELIRGGELRESERDDVRHVLTRRHTHQYEQTKSGGSASGSTANGGGQGSGFLNAVRSISDIGKSFSHGKNLHKHASATSTSPAVAEPAAGAGSPTKKHFSTNQLELPKVGSLPKDLQHSNSAQSDLGGGGQGRNAHFMKKLPPGVEASNILVGEVDFLQRHVTAFVRLQQASILGDFTEVSVPTRFLFLLLGPQGHAAQFKEIGRAMATLMSDEIFHDVAYKARNRNDLIDGVDEFLDAVTVLPPGEWDPNIRIEPPTVIPSQQKRVQIPKEMFNGSGCVNAAAATSGVTSCGGGGTSGGAGAKESVGGVGGQPAGGLGGALSGSALSHFDASKEEEFGHALDPALQRTGRLFGGLMADIRRKAPYYKSDFTDAFNLQCLAAFCFMYFALLAPIVTFGGLLEEATHQRMAAMENLASGAICGIIYHLFSGQPLTIIGSTGPVLVFETIVFDMCTSMSIDYLSFRFWVHMWTAGILFLMVITDASSLVSYITRFTEESFATLIAVIFIYEAMVKLYKIGDTLTLIPHPPVEDPARACHCVPTGASIQQVLKLAHKNHLDRVLPPNSTSIDYSKLNLGYCQRLLGRLEGDNCFVMYDRLLMSLVLMVGTFLLAVTFKGMRNRCYFGSRVRQIISDFAVMISITLMTTVDALFGVDTPKLNVPSTFRPTWEGRGWFVSPLMNPVWSIPFASIPALLACILIFMDQQISAVIVNRKENKLKKGCGYHLDLMVLSVLILIVGALGLPIYVAATVLSINHVNSLKMESQSRAPGEVAQFIGVREQRVTGMVTFLFIGLSVLMTKVLSHIPMPVLYGVFLYMGISALGGIQLFDRILLLFMPMKYQPDTIYIRHVPIRVIHRFTLCQVTCLAVLWVVKSIKATSIAFPVMLVLMVAVRKLMERYFSEKDLKYLDDKMPDFHLRRKEDNERRRTRSVRREANSSGAAVAARSSLPPIDGGAETFEIDLDENQGTIHAVKTAAHLHIYSEAGGQHGNVIKIPLAAISQQPSHNINISRELNSSGMWRHITNTNGGGGSSSKGSMQNFVGGSELDAGNSPRLATPEEDDEAITINIVKSTPAASPSAAVSNEESQPLLRKKSKQRGGGDDDDPSPV